MANTESNKSSVPEPVTKHSEPVVFYVAWHPDCKEGKRLAKALFDWFHLGEHDIGRMGIGVPVYYRSLPESGPTKTEKPGSPIKIIFDEAMLSIVLLLIDKHMVTDSGWAKYIGELHGRMNSVNDAAEADAKKKTGPNGGRYYGDLARIFPVALDETAFRMPGEISSLNFLRIEERGDPEIKLKRERDQLRTCRFLSQVTELSCREMLKRREVAIEGKSPNAAPKAPGSKKGIRIDDDFGPSKINVFLSHSKSDGAEIAEALRDYMNRKSQLRPFYDAVDLALGYRYATRLNDKAERGTVSMIAIHSDSYPFRPWCRREIKLARRPRIPSRRNEEVPDRQCWWMNPVVIVAALKKQETRSMPEFGQAPVIRWSEMRERKIVDILLRELFFQTYHYFWAVLKWDKLVEERKKNPDKARSVKRLHMLSWIPTLRTIEEIRSQIDDDWNTPLEIYHPGQGMPADEVKVAKKLLPNGSILQSFDEIAFESTNENSESGEENPVSSETEVNPRPCADPVNPRLIGVSMSTDEEEIGKLGYAPEHLHYYLLVIIRRMLRIGAHIAYGGDMCDSDRQYSESMIQVAQEELTGGQADGIELPLVGSARPAFYSFLAWPQAGRWEIGERAQFVGSCDFVEIDGIDPKHDVRATAGAAGGRSITRLRRTLALSEMRYTMTNGEVSPEGRKLPHLAARVSMGGRLRDFEGILPGVYEEIFWTLERNISKTGKAKNERTALFLVGGLGGAAQTITKYLLSPDPEPALPPETEIETFLRDDRTEPRNRAPWRRNLKILVKDYDEFVTGGECPPWMKPTTEFYGDFRELLGKARENDFELLENGLDAEDNRLLMRSRDITVVSRLIEKGMRKRYEAK